ncbi:MAG: tetratricopeptide repeat protein [Bacteroidia bacterium]|nr:tetratricopeptide repeat protein [Bacteroidia bacterium]
MIKKCLTALLMAALSHQLLTAQQSAAYTSDLVDYQKALTLYNSKQYLAAQSLFNQIENEANDEVLKSDCAYYIANCAVRLNQQNADDLIMNFVEDYPTSTKRNTAFIDVADYYFENSKYAYARKWYERVDEEALSRSERPKYNFNYGYSNFATDNLSGAKKYLTRVENSPEYGSQAKYYIGFMAYQGDDYEKASEYFDQIGDEEKYQEKLSYYQADLNFKLGNFEKAISLAKEQLPNSDDNEKSELSKIIGESYFNLQKYSEAIPFLKDYKGKRGRWTNTDYYQLGYAYFKQDAFEEAVSEFNKIIDGDNTVAQNAFYHLGESYIKLDKKQEALNAFRNASQMEYDLKIQEDAWLNYAKISYDIGNPYQSVPQVLSAYLDNYPETAYREEIETLLIDSYITSKNYKEALDLLENRKSYENKLAYQKVAFYRGVELYNESNFLVAESFFDKSLSQALDEVFTARATFWKAETDYNLGDFDDAMVGFKQYQGMASAAETSEMTNIDYNIGYTYFKLKRYQQAQDYFQSYIDSGNQDKLRINDAYLRLGDGYFVSSNYNSAINAYSKALDIDEIEQDYAHFQSALSYGYLGKADEKISGLEAFVNRYARSGLRDDALYELGNSYVKRNEIDKAMSRYDQLNAEYPQSSFRSKAMLRQGLVFYNSGDNDRALNKFKSVADNFPGTPEAVQAVSSARMIYVDLGRVDEYARWVRTLDYVDVTDADLDNAAYEAAEKQYLANNDSRAIKQFNSYINQFPNGIHALNAHFYLAQLYYKADLKANALPHYEYVIKRSANEFSETALTRVGEIYLLDKNYNDAIPILKRLETEADFPQNILFAQSNLMKAYYRLESYNDAVAYADKVLLNTKVDKSIRSDAQIIIARSAFKTGDEAKARTAYSEVEKIASGELAAEALFYNAYFKNKDGNYKASNATVQKLARDYSSYKYYAAKGLVVMAKNYYALDDAYQANYILESVIENFKEFDDVVDEARQELRRIKNEQSRTNSSVITDEGN